MRVDGTRYRGGRVGGSLPAGGSGFSLTAEDLSRGQSARDSNVSVNKRARATITLGKRRFRVEPDGFAEVAAAVREDMLPALLQTPFRTDFVPTSARRQPADEQAATPSAGNRSTAT